MGDLAFCGAKLLDLFILSDTEAAIYGIGTLPPPHNPLTT